MHPGLDTQDWECFQWETVGNSRLKTHDTFLTAQINAMKICGSEIRRWFSSFITPAWGVSAGLGVWLVSSSADLGTSSPDI